MRHRRPSPASSAATRDPQPVRRPAARRAALFAVVLGGCGAPPYFPALDFGDTGPHGNFDTGDTSDWPRDASGAYCSAAGSGAAFLELHNETAQVLRVDWVDGSCVSTTYHTLEPGGIAYQPTYFGHAWAARNASGTELLATYIITEANQVEVVP